MKEAVLLFSMKDTSLVLNIQGNMRIAILVLRIAILVLSLVLNIQGNMRIAIKC